MTETIQRIVLASRPVGEPSLDNFRSEKLPIPHLGSDAMLLRTLWLSLDPYMRGRMSDAPSYAKPVGRLMPCPMVPACKRSIQREHLFRLHWAFSECPE